MRASLAITAVIIPFICVGLLSSCSTQVFQDEGIGDSSCKEKSNTIENRRFAEILSVARRIYGSPDQMMDSEQYETEIMIELGEVNSFLKPTLLKAIGSKHGVWENRLLDFVFGIADIDFRGIEPWEPTQEIKRYIITKVLRANGLTRQFDEKCASRCNMASERQVPTLTLISGVFPSWSLSSQSANSRIQSLFNTVELSSLSVYHIVKDDYRIVYYIKDVVKWVKSRLADSSTKFDLRLRYICNILLNPNSTTWAIGSDLGYVKKSVEEAVKGTRYEPKPDKEPIKRTRRERHPKHNE